MTGKNFFGSKYFSILTLTLVAASSTMAQQCVTCSTSVNLGSGVTVMTQQQASAGSGAGSFISAVGMITPEGSVLQVGNTYLAWCVDDPSAPLNDPAFATAYSTANNTLLPVEFQNANWPRINWVLNNRQGIPFEDVQRVIWQLAGKPDSSIPFPGTAASVALLAAANANGATFVPGPGQKLAVLLAQDGPGGLQDTIVEVTLPSCGTIGSLVWSDTNGNGIQDTGEAGINNVEVTLTAYDGTVLRTTTSTIDNVQGTYFFNNLCSGAYTVRTSGPGGSVIPSPSNRGTDRGTDSNGSPAVVTLNLAVNPSDLTIDFGYVPAVSDNCTGSIGDFVWFDVNGNGIQETGEFGLAGVTVKLMGAATAQVITGANGSYNFSNLCSGSYAVSVVNPSKVQTGRPGLAATFTGAGTVQTDSNTNPTALFLPTNTNDLTRDFGFRSVGGCTLTQGYWKTHSSVWPVTSLFLGGKSYSAAELLNILNTAVKGDASIILAYQLIAAKLNLYSGSAVPSSVAAFIAQADALLATFSGKIPLKAGSNAAMTSLGASLDTYNNGRVAGTSHCN